MAEIETKSFAVKNFDRISFRALGNVKIIQGEEEGLMVSGEPGALDHVKIEVEGTELVIKLITWYDFLFIPRSADYEIKIKNLHAISISGSAALVCDELLTSEMKLSVSGSGKIDMDSLEAARAQFSVSGSGRIEVKSLVSNQIALSSSGSGKFVLGGNAQSLEIRTSGTASVSAFDLAAQDVDVHISGAGNFEVQAHNKLNVSVSGSGKVAYHGNPQVTQSISGSASIYKAD
jgi:hypothetical protein